MSRTHTPSLSIGVAVLLLLSPGLAHADTLADYNQDNAALEQLLQDRQSAVTSLQRWTAAEQTSLDQLASAETKLHGLIVDRASVEAQQPILAQQVADRESAAAALDAQVAALNKRVEAMETWLDGDAAAPRSNNMRGYLRAKDILASDALSSDELQSELDSARQEQKAAVDRLGQDNTEISWWQAQAGTLAGQVGGARARALSVNGRLADLQKQGADLAVRVQDEFQALVSAGYPVGVAKIVAAGPEAGPGPIPEPVDWPSSAPAYALPVGRTDASLVASSPLFTTKERLLATGVVGDPSNWQAPLRGVVTTPFGDGTPYQDAHYALDIGAHLYAPIVAASDGVVEYAGLAASDNRLASYGLVVVIRHNEHVTSLYAHMDDRANGLAVNVGDHVSKGQLIGYVGLTGYSTGPHLHFEVRVDGQPIDPMLLANPQP